MPTPSAAAKPTLVYCHCDCYWPLELGPSCPMEHDDGPHTGRKRRVWICEDCEERTAYFPAKAFQEHLEDSHAA